MKRYGRFLENSNELSSTVINYLSSQLGLPLTFAIKKSYRKATYVEQRKLIFEHLNFRSFADKDLKLLVDLVSTLLNKGFVLIEQLYPEAEQFLIINHIALPSQKQLKPSLKSLYFRYYTAQYDRIYHLLPTELILYIDNLLTVSENSSWFDQLKEYPAAASISTLNYYLKKYDKLCEVSLDQIDFHSLNQGFINYHYQLARYYSANKVKRFKTDKRYALVAIFLYESKNVYY